MEIPEIGLGTWMLQGGKCTEVVQKAIELGYRHIDTAFAYENHEAVGKGLIGFPREKLFITSKIFLKPSNSESAYPQIENGNSAEFVAKACDFALKELGLEYLDLMLIHWPIREQPLEEIFAALLDQVDKGKLRFAGVSNYTKHHLEDAYRAGLKVSFNQVEFHPYLYQKELLDYARKNGTELIAYRPLGKGDLIKEPLFTKMGKEHQKSPSQVILRWLLQKKVPFLVKASSEKHLKENLDILDFSLTPEEEKNIDQLNRNFRFAGPEWADFDY